MNKLTFTLQISILVATSALGQTPCHPPSELQAYNGAWAVKDEELAWIPDQRIFRSVQAANNKSISVINQNWTFSPILRGPLEPEDPKLPRSAWYLFKYKGSNADVQSGINKLQQALDSLAEWSPQSDSVRPKVEANYVWSGTTPPAYPVRSPNLMLRHPGLTASDPGVAIFDTGISTINARFTNRMWSNPKRFPFFDRNGQELWCPEGAVGYDATKGAIGPEAVLDHGTHVAGIAAEHQGFYLLDCKVICDDGTIDTASILNGVEFVREAKRNGSNIRVILMAFGGFDVLKPELVTSIHDAMKIANDYNILVVCSAGNGHENSDFYPRLPSKFAVPVEGELLNSVLAVGSVGPLGIDGYPFSRTSNYGTNSVQLCAVGEGRSAPSLDGEHFDAFYGTSASAADVAGLAGSIAAQTGSALTAQNLKWRLLITSDYQDAFDQFALFGVANEGSAIFHKAPPGCQVYASPGFIAMRKNEERDVLVIREPYKGDDATLSPPPLVDHLRVTVTPPELTVAPGADEFHLKIRSDGATRKMYKVRIQGLIAGTAVSETMLTVSIY